MAVVLQTLVDSDFEHVVKITTSSTNSAASIVDASALAGADTNPRDHPGWDDQCGYRPGTAPCKEQRRTSPTPLCWLWRSGLPKCDCVSELQNGNCPADTTGVPGPVNDRTGNRPGRTPLPSR